MSHTGLERMIDHEKARLCALEKEYRSMPKGALHIRYRRGRYFFWEYCEKKQIGITRNKALVYRLARKKYLECKIIPLKKRIAILEAAHDSLGAVDECSLVTEACEYCKMLDLDKVIYSTKELAWINRTVSDNPYRRENLKYATRRGVMTRSKSERLIGNVLEERGIIYVVEPEILIDGKAYYPDFMLLRADGTTVIWEHCGLMDDKDYSYRTLMKIAKYRSIGYVQTDNLIYTFEEDLEDMKRLHEIIDRFFVQ